MIVADTDVLIDYLNNKGSIADRIDRELRAGLATTVISRFELLGGARRTNALAKLKRLLAALGTLRLDSESADRAADIRRELEDRGSPIGMADSLIAGIVLRHRAILLTRNRRHFERIPSLHLAEL
jgi:predicted nucleic acid-binding protein